MLAELSVEMREATTHYMNVTCKDPITGEPFNLAGYEVQTWLSFGLNKGYASNIVADNFVSYKIPAEISVGAKSGVAETRIFKDGDVFEVLRVNISVHKADKPDIEPS